MIISILIFLAISYFIISNEWMFVSAQSIKENKLKNESTNYIQQIYPTKLTGEVYRFNNSKPNDMIQVNENEDPTIFSKKNTDNSWRVDPGKTRIEIFTKDAGALSEENLKLKATSWNYEELRKIGYWLSAQDWKNIEFTLIFKFDKPSAIDNKEHDISIVTRSIFHDIESEYTGDPNDHDYNDNENNNTNPVKPYYCGGSSYHNNLSNEGHVRMKKEQFHVEYDIDEYDKNVNLGDLYNKTIGIKAIVYNSEDNTKVKLETWIDTENQGKGPYKKVQERIDKGKWGKYMKICGAEKKGAVISWGSPNVVIKTNNVQFEIYDIEVREIVPPQF
ncbi:MAG: hypothetical protein MRJ93_05390 [Nitrososphaeraceae archaeon]|nr:hypothetical protein [Nitrososphaeraceae archaeon]